MANVFPFSALDTQLLPRVADELAAPYQQRLESEVRDVIETQRLLLLRGPAGLGKTREAFEATKRLAQQRDSLTVLVPNTAQTDVAWEWPEGLPDHEVVLFADNLHGRYVRPASGVPLGGGQQNWLHDTMRRFGSREQRLRVIATIRDDEPDGRVWRQQLGYTQGHRFWRQFGDVLQLGDWDYEAKLELINDYAKVSNLTLEDGAAQLLARRTDGRARTILMALKLMPGASVTRAMVEAAPASYRNATDEAWAKIAPFPERAAWIEALALCREADLTATRPLVEGIARLLLPRVPWPNSTLSRPRRVIGTLQALWTARLSRRQRLNDALRNTPAVEVRRDGRLSADDLLLDGRASLRDHALLVRRVVTSLLWEAGGPNAADLAAFGRRLHAMASRQEPELLEAAIDCYQDALAQYRDDDHPADWAQTQNNLGAALWDPLQRDKRSNLEAAVRCHEAALTVYNEQDYPVDWAWTQRSLGTALGDRLEGDKRSNLEAAIRCYEAGLRVATADGHWYVHQGLVENLRLTRKELLVEEGLRTEAHPGIMFRPGPGTGGRRPGLTAGPDVWEILQVYRQLSGTPEHRAAVTAKNMGLSAEQVACAARYYDAYPAEIDAWLEELSAEAKAAHSAWMRAHNLPDDETTAG